MTAPMVIRRDAVDACIQRFSGKAMKWGTVDCAKIVALNLHRLGIATSLVSGQKYTSEHGALKALRGLGFAGLGEAMDGLDLPRIPPAMATQGDVIGMACEGEVWDMALVVKASSGRAFGILDGIAQPMQPDLTGAVAAWRCNPCRV